MWRSVIMSSLIVALLGSSARLETSHAATRNISNQDFFVMFFVPGSRDITPEARWIVEQAAASAKAQEASAIEIALSSGQSRVSLVQARTAAIEKVLSAEGSEIHFLRRPLSKSEISIPGAEDRAEIRIVQR